MRGKASFIYDFIYRLAGVVAAANRVMETIFQPAIVTDLYK